MVPQDVPSLAAALNAATDGDTIVAWPGLFREALVIPPIEITLAGRYLLSGDSLDVDSCVLSPPDSLVPTRCMVASSDPPSNSKLTIVGLTMRNSRAQPLVGGAIYASGRPILIDHCVFDSCSARNGGAVACQNSSEVIIRKSRVLNCHATIGSGSHAIFAQQCRVTIECCSFAANSPVAGGTDDIQFRFDNSPLNFWGNRIATLGWAGEEQGDGATLFWFSPPADTLQLNANQITECRVNRFANFANPFTLFRFDSNLVTDCQCFQTWISGPFAECLMKSNLFANNSRMRGTAGQGFFFFGENQIVRATDNYFLNNQLANVTLGTIIYQTAGRKDITRNYAADNTPQQILPLDPPCLMLVTGLQDSEFFHNVFRNNNGRALQRFSFSVSSHAEQNYWGAASGPYQSATNPGGEGDTLSELILFDPWEPDTSFLPVTEKFFVAPEDWSLEQIFPNPFNGQTHIRIISQKPQPLSVAAYNTLGQKIADIWQGVLAKDEPTLIRWDGINTFGGPVASGVYYIVAEPRGSSGGALKAQKAVLLR